MYMGRTIVLGRVYGRDQVVEKLYVLVDMMIVKLLNSKGLVEDGSENCPREAVLKLVRKINPKIFFPGVVNGSYSASFFLTRFREALYHFSSLFDMFEANVPRRGWYLRKGCLEEINVIACEGATRVERPETIRIL